MLKIVSTLLLVLSSSAFAEWKHGSELGMTQVDGNTESTTFVAKHKSIKSTEKSTYTAKGDYSYGKNDTDTTDSTPGVLAVRNWNALLRYDRKFSDRLSWFVQASVFGDQFQFVRWRANYDIPGLTYHIIPKKGNDFFSVDLAYRFSQEERTTTPETPVIADFKRDNSNGYIAFHYGKQITKSLVGLADLKYAKRFTGDERALTNLDLGLQNQLSETFALKLGYSIAIDDSIESPQEDTQTIFTVNLLATY